MKLHSFKKRLFLFFNVLNKNTYFYDLVQLIFHLESIKHFFLYTNLKTNYTYIVYEKYLMTVISKHIPLVN